ncbi:MAG: hypothetical protein ACI9FU_000719 [Granulosicoccus sp.]|jgi:hypothetical protein
MKNKTQITPSPFSGGELSNSLPFFKEGWPEAGVVPSILESKCGLHRVFQPIGQPQINRLSEGRGIEKRITKK